MLPDEVRKAVEAIEFRLRGVWEPQADVHADFAAIKAHLLAREAEVEGMRTLLDLLRTDGKGKKYHCVISRAGSVVPVDAHLSENSRG